MPENSSFDEDDLSFENNKKDLIVNGDVVKGGNIFFDKDTLLKFMLIIMVFARNIKENGKDNDKDK